MGTLHTTPPTQGDTVVTNIDLGLQEAVQTALQNDIAADKHTVDPTTGKLPTANDGAAVVLDAQTGAVLAMASYPTYDLSVWLGGISQANYSALSAGCNTTSTTTGCPLINYAIDGLYTPGSTFKLNTATAALDDGIISANQYVDDTGVYHVPAEMHLGLHVHRRRGIRCRRGRPGGGPHQVRRLLLLQSGRPLLLLLESRRDPKDGGGVRPGGENRHRPPGRRRGSGRQRLAARQPAQGGPVGLPLPELLRR